MDEDDLVDVMARAMCATDTGLPADDVWSSYHWRDWVGVAHAALAVVRQVDAARVRAVVGRGGERVLLEAALAEAVVALRDIMNERCEPSQRATEVLSHIDLWT